MGSKKAREFVRKEEVLTGEALNTRGACLRGVGTQGISCMRTRRLGGPCISRKMYPVYGETG